MNLEAIITPDHLRETSLRVSKLIKSKSYTYDTKMARELRYWSARPKLFRWATNRDYKQFFDYAVKNPPHGSIFQDTEKKVNQLRKKASGFQNDPEKLKKIALEEFALFQMRPELSDELLAVPFSDIEKAIMAYDEALVQKVPEDILLFEAEQEEIEAQTRANQKEWNRKTTTAPAISKAEFCDFSHNINRGRLVLKFVLPDFFGGSIASGLWRMFKESGVIEHRQEEGLFYVTFDKDCLPELHNLSNEISAAVEAVYDLDPNRAGLVSPSSAAKSLGIKTSEVRDLIEVGALSPRKIVEIKTGRLAGKTFHGIAPRDIIALAASTPSEPPTTEAVTPRTWSSLRNIFRKS